MSVHVTLKIATSLDGRSALKSGESKWITGEAARARVQKMRRNSDAILIGARTLEADNPRLTVRADPPAAIKPLRVVAGRTVRLSPDAALADGREAPTLVLIGPDSMIWNEAELTARGVRFERIPLGTGGQLDPGAMLGAIARFTGKSDARLLIEGGATLGAAFIAAGLVDCLEWHRAPIVLGSDSLPALVLPGPAQLKDAWRFDLVATERLGSDLIERYARQKTISTPS